MSALMYITHTNIWIILPCSLENTTLRETMWEKIWDAIYLSSLTIIQIDLRPFFKWLLEDKVVLNNIMLAVLWSVPKVLTVATPLQSYDQISGA